MGFARLDEEGVSTVEAARRLGVTQATLWRWIEEGRLPSYRVGRKLLRIRLSDLEDFLENCRVAPGSLGRR